MSLREAGKPYQPKLRLHSGSASDDAQKQGGGYALFKSMVSVDALGD